MFVGCLLNKGVGRERESIEREREGDVDATRGFSEKKRRKHLK